MNVKLEYWSLDNKDVTSFIESGKTQLFDNKEEAREYASLRRSYSYEIEVYEEHREGLFLIGYGYAVPQ